MDKMGVTVRGTRIKSNRAIKYLAVIVDDRLSFKEHMKDICEKAPVTQTTLARMMPRRTTSIQKEANFGGNNFENAVCLPNMVISTLR